MERMSISINIYDLLPEGTISNIAWMLGIGIYHSGLVIGDKEYAYGGHSLENVSGIYTTVPRTIPPGGRFRTSIKYGSIIIMPDEVEEIICDIGKEFQGLSYNLLTSRNCNHFTSHLLYRLTSLSTPKWLNRAAAIGVAFPYMVPSGWIEPPTVENDSEAELFDSTILPIKNISKRL
ncbi:hypothetical protein PNEG_02140 [Pneumocystis murina B123]|uniref:PPPDE domain-containing protein n=1 Tax=Pneumocystis murina (strain B123) TaxID=1069680 RepID=M7PGH2_PNEMU|nr:hypothetical protein PNEG_02140 [Pneumocystis murina B123]EMR09554.1 hypothetical protein PNEG_02140 [Pneumocystis murina B123]